MFVKKRCPINHPPCFITILPETQFLSVIEKPKVEKAFEMADVQIYQDQPLYQASGQLYNGGKKSLALQMSSVAPTLPHHWPHWLGVVTRHMKN